MLTQIDVMSANAFELPILGVTPKSSLLLQNVTGLNPPDRVLFIGDYAQDGGLYQDNRVGNRNPVFYINLNPNPALGETVASLRRQLQKEFMNPQPDDDGVKFLMHFDDQPNQFFVGYADKFESEVFDVETMCQVSLICTDPYIRDDLQTMMTSSAGWIQVPFTYPGTARTGFEVRAYITAATTSFTLANNSKPMYFTNPDGFAVGDILWINTVRGYRFATWTKGSLVTSEPIDYVYNRTYLPSNFVFYNGGIWRCLATITVGDEATGYVPNSSDGYWRYLSTSIVSQLAPASDWLELHAQANSLRVYGGVNVSSVVASIKMLRFSAAYWGI